MIDVIVFCQGAGRHDPDFLLRQFIEIINETVNLSVGGIGAKMSLFMALIQVSWLSAGILKNGQPFQIILVFYRRLHAEIGQHIYRLGKGEVELFRQNTER
jgi:hypothetical protein